MPRVLIVEDEPAAGRYLRSMIELGHSGFEVIGIAKNGSEALDQIRRLDPDLVITDVKMPVMDGIELVAELKLHYPSLPAVIVSGHQEFEYARRALDTGVVDYLLKPVDPARLAELLARLQSLCSERECSRRAEVLDRIVKGEARAAELEGGESYWLAAARVGGLPSRFRFDEASPEAPSCREGFFVLPGRDSREQVYLGQRPLVTFEAFAAAVRSAAPRAAAEGGPRGGSGGEHLPFRTVLISTETAAADRLHASARELCLELDSLLVAGLSQVHCGSPKSAPEVEWDRVLAERIELALRECRVDQLEASVRAMAESWRENRRPLVYVESQLRGILHFVLRKTPRARGFAASSLEFLLDEALAGVSGFGELADAAWALVSRTAGAEDLESRDSDVPAFFESIRSYVEARYSEQLNLADLSKTFRISASYLSKLFRRYADRSFGAYLASLRIEAAKRLIRDSPQLPLKEVAEKVGFNDPFYFSRVFKTLAGLPPSDFARHGRGEEPRAAE
jgi:two-component system response regulator YesN